MAICLKIGGKVRGEKCEDDLMATFPLLFLTFGASFRGNRECLSTERAFQSHISGHAKTVLVLERSLCSAFER